MTKIPTKNQYIYIPIGSLWEKWSLLHPSANNTTRKIGGYSLIIRATTTPAPLTPNQPPPKTVRKNSIFVDAPEKHGPEGQIRRRSQGIQQQDARRSVQEQEKSWDRCQDRFFPCCETAGQAKEKLPTVNFWNAHGERNGQEKSLSLLFALLQSWNCPTPGPRRCSVAMRKVSAVRDDRRHLRFDISELQRAYGELKTTGDDAQPTQQGNDKAMTGHDQVEILAIKDNQIADLRNQLEKAEAQLQIATTEKTKLLDLLSAEKDEKRELKAEMLALMPPPEERQQKSAPTQIKQRGWLQRLIGA